MKEWLATDVRAGEAFGYGTPEECRAKSELADAIQRICDAFPPDILQELQTQYRKERADKLRAEADAIERGDIL